MDVCGDASRQFHRPVESQESAKPRNAGLDWAVSLLLHTYMYIPICSMSVCMHVYLVGYLVTDTPSSHCLLQLNEHPPFYVHYM